MQRHLRIVVIAAGGILAIQIMMGIAVIKSLPDWPTRGQFGDLFGVVNALFSGLAFAGLIYAILLQREDLALQRTELELTRKEMARSAAAQEQSEEALHAQAESAATSARLSATSFLLEAYSEELSQLKRIGLRATDPRNERIKELENRISLLTLVLDEVFGDITKKGA